MEEDKDKEEKPVSLEPLDFEGALEKLLETPPPPEDEEEPKDKS